MNNLSFTLAKDTDLSKLLEIENTVFTFPWPRHQLTEELNKNLIWSLSLDETIIGFVVLNFIIDECEILRIGICRNMQRQRFGTKLLQFAIDKAIQEKCRIIFLEVRESDQPACRFYCKMGFKQIGRRKDYYRSVNNQREDAIIMQLKIQQENKINERGVS